MFIEEYSNMEIMPQKGVKTQKTTYLNRAAYYRYAMRLSLLAMSVFEWDGLPETVNTRFLESCLFHEGRAMIFKEANTGAIVCARCAPGGAINFNDEYTALRPFGINMDASRDIDMDECVLVRNNDFMIPTQPILLDYAQELASIKRTIDINIIAQKIQFFFSTNDKKLQSANQLIQKIDENNPFIVVNDAFNMKEALVVPTHVQFIGDKLEQQRRDVWNDGLNFLGIKRMADRKKERLITSEVDSDEEQVNASLATFLKCREEAAAKASRLFGCKATVIKRKSLNPEPPEGEKETPPKKNKEEK
jgi:hypothetical protein